MSPSPAALRAFLTLRSNTAFVTAVWVARLVAPPAGRCGAGSDLLLAEVAPRAQAGQALERVGVHLPSELRASFAKQGRLAAGLGRRT